jgi:phosphate starvation-inducible protein PhoH
VEDWAKRDVVRHPLVQRIIMAYEEHRGALDESVSCAAQPAAHSRD